MFFCEKPRSHVGTARTCTPSPTLKTLIVLGGTCQICPLQWSSLSGFQNINQDFANVFQVWWLLLLPNSSFCITCGKLQKKHLEALGNSTDFMLLALGDRHLPQPAGCGNYNLLPYLFLYLYRLYQYLAAFPTSVSASKFPSWNFWFSRIPGASTLILQRQEAYLEPWWPALFRIGREFLKGQKILKKHEETTKLKKDRGWKPPPEDAPKFFSYKPFRLQIWDLFSPKITYFWTEKCVSFKQIRKSQPREIRLKNRFKTLPHFFSNPPIPRKSIPPTRNSHVHGIHCFT